MKKAFMFLIIIIIALFCFAEYTQTTVFTAKWGKGEGEYQIWGESPPIGPGPMAVDEEGNLFIIDKGNDKLHIYNSSGSLVKDLFIKGLQERVLIVDNNEIVILQWIDGGQFLNKYNKVNYELIEHRELNSTANRKLDYAVDMGGYYKVVASYKTFKTFDVFNLLTTESEPKGESIRDTFPSGTAIANLFRRDYGNHDDVYAVFLYKDKNGNLYYEIMGKDYDNNDSHFQNYLIQVSKDYKLCEVIKLPMTTNMIQNMFERICITDNGDIYYLKINGDLILDMKKYPLTDIYNNTLELIKWFK